MPSHSPSPVARSTQAEARKPQNPNFALTLRKNTGQSGIKIEVIPYTHTHTKKTTGKAKNLER